MTGLPSLPPPPPEPTEEQKAWLLVLEVVKLCPTDVLGPMYRAVKHELRDRGVDLRVWR